MAIPKIETFEDQIAVEIKEKEGMVADIVAANSQVKVGRGQKNFAFSIMAAVFFIAALLAAGIFYYFPKSNSVEEAKTPTQNNAGELPVGTAVPRVNKAEELNVYTTLPKSSIQIGRFIEGVVKKESGYILRLKDYPPVAAALLYGEGSFGADILKLYGKEATSSISFRDITKSNQDIRVSEEGVAYAFIGTTTLIFSNNVDNLMRLRSGIVK